MRWIRNRLRAQVTNDQTLAVFSGAYLTLTPEPDMVLIVFRTLAQGRASGFATLARIQAAAYVCAMAAACGLSAL